ncbi:MAG: LytR family transcriptional regulator, partial [Mycobacterium sp.]
MSDGDAGADAATQGHDGDDVGLTGTPPGSRGAAPWERFGAPSHAVAVAHRWSTTPATSPPAEQAEPAGDDHESGGSHTDGGLTVADLIAKVGAPAAGRPRHH